ncbi:golgin subfamily A member 6-like protein 4 [Astyanax mexicanus]|uniref:golgin subfamily A member 6-like protein 4 n=1 Tax=Astyanax mexicanus TaxID=7994 RepID=UPI0020CAD2EE|nr:golgin subfamily A member 6-like protein 4 [Astyanax mexicanus]
MVLMAEGRASVERNQERVERIRNLKEELHREEKTQKEALKESDQSGHSPTSLEEWSQVEYCKLLEQRKKLKEDHERVMQEELLKMEKELQEEQSEGAEGEVMYLNRERQILVLQIEALRRENQQAEEGLEAQYRLHQQEVHSLREESLQVFRTFRQVLEEQKRLSEGRYRTLLLEAIQDAVHLSTLNQQLQTENKQLRKALGVEGNARPHQAEGVRSPQKMQKM